MGDLAKQLHDAVMNLPVPPRHGIFPYQADSLYLLGHRDARHAAAELVLTSDALRKLEADRDALLAACKAWVAYFDWLARNDAPGDPLAAARKKNHGERVEATRAAIAKAEAAADQPAGG